MILFFSWRRILRKAGKSSNRILLVLRAISLQQSKTLPKNKYDPTFRYYYSDYYGKSYLLNLQELLFNYFRWTNKEIAQYVGLASLRSYAHYLVAGDRTLDLFHTSVSEDIINKNRLLRIVKGRVHFYYEEVPNRRNKIWH